MDKLFQWPVGIQCAISLTYDDGLPVHTTLVAPLLEQHGVHATFFLPVLSDLKSHPETWRKLAAKGHELGNHTLFHPCRRDPEMEYTWLPEYYDLCNYTPCRILDELEVANFVLSLIDGQSVRTYGNTCCHTTIGCGEEKQSIEPILSGLFPAARGEITDRCAKPGKALNLLNIGCCHVDGHTLQQLQTLVNTTIKQGGWAVLMAHGVGEETHKLYLEEQVHQEFITWLASQKEIWIAPMREIAHYIKQQG